MYFSDGGHMYTERQMRQITTEWLPHVTIGAHHNAEESHAQAFIAFFFAIRSYLRSQANLVAIWCELCKHHA